MIGRHVDARKRRASDHGFDLINRVLEKIWVKQHFLRTGPEGTASRLACQVVADVPSLHWAAAAEVQVLVLSTR